MRKGVPKAKARRRVTGGAAGSPAVVGLVPPDPVPVEPRLAGSSEPRPPAAKLVHDLNGSLAAIGLHLHLAADGDLPARSAENLRKGLAAVRHMREQMAELAELLSQLPPRALAAPRRSS